jgi:hypothetical protein
MNVNQPECQSIIEKLKTRLQDNYDVIYIKNSLDLLVKTNPNTKIPVGVVAPTTNTLPSTGTINVCPMNTNASITNNTCSCHSECASSSSMMCPLNKNNNTSNDTNFTKPYSKGECLVRFMPTDVYNAIFMHVIILHGEHTDLKMRFDITEQGVVQMIETLNFLVK